MWLVVTLCMAVIFFGWLWSLADLNKQFAVQPSEEKTTSGGWEQFKKDIPSLWSSLGEGIGNAVGSVKEALESEKESEVISPSPTSTLEPQTLPIE